MQKTTQKLFLDLQTNGVGSEVVGSKIESGSRPMEDPKSGVGTLAEFLLMFGFSDLLNSQVPPPYQSLCIFVIKFI